MVPEDALTLPQYAHRRHALRLPRPRKAPPTPEEGTRRHGVRSSIDARPVTTQPVRVRGLRQSSPLRPGWKPNDPARSRVGDERPPTGMPPGKDDCPPIPNAECPVWRSVASKWTDHKPPFTHVQSEHEASAFIKRRGSERRSWNSVLRGPHDQRMRATLKVRIVPSSRIATYSPSTKRWLPSR